MDTVTCSVCGQESPPGDYCKNCRSELAPLVADAPEPAVEPAARGAVERCAAPGCGQPLAAGEAVCRYCGEAAPGSAPAVASTLSFPWGDHRLDEGESVVLGREQPPFATQLAQYGNVGRSHARIARGDGTLRVTDLNSLNGTHVDGRRIPPELPEELRPGQVLRLGATLEIGIR